MDDAAEWVESSPDAIRLMETPEPTQDTVNTFKSLFCEMFPSKAVEVTSVPYDLEVRELRQKPEESLNQYQKRVINLMTRIGARDRLPNVQLTPVESTMLDFILRSFINGITDIEL